MITPDTGVVKVIDFGFSSNVSAPQSKLTHCGSLDYSAPEIVTKQSYCGPEVDIWSLGILLALNDQHLIVCAGVLLYVMTSGTFPFQGSNETEIVENIKSGVFMVPDFLSEELLELIGSILNPDPRKRATMEDILKNPWCQGSTVNSPVGNRTRRARSVSSPSPSFYPRTSPTVSPLLGRKLFTILED